MNPLNVQPSDLKKISDDDLRSLVAHIAKFQNEDVKENALLYYHPVSDKARAVHMSVARTVGIGGGNGSSKTETALVELLIMATGIIPLSLKDTYPREKLRGPVNTRVILESLTTVLHPVFLPKLMWWRWQGVDEPGGKRGHWGWVPKSSLIDGSWEKSWTERTRILRLYYRNPDHPEEILGESTIQFMSHDQDPTDFASGDFHFVLLDEPPRYAIWRENQARTMRVRGRLMLAMTWPDEPAIPVDWLFDEVYDRAQPGPYKDANVEWFELYTTDNPNLDQEAVRATMAQWSESVRKVRIFGQPIRFSNRIHPLFTDVVSGWCFACGGDAMLLERRCAACGSEDVTTYCHVGEFDHSPILPVIFLLDPHPRKPHMMSWVQVDTFDDLSQVVDAKVDGDPTDVRKRVEQIEREYKLHVVKRIMDPNMGASPSGAIRGVTWADEFANAGIRCDLADDSDVGRARINEYLKPDARTMRPRLRVHSRCRDTIYQMNRYVWDDFKAALEKDLKQKAKEKYDDFPTLLKYCLNSGPSFQWLSSGAPIIRRKRINSEGRR